MNFEAFILGNTLFGVFFADLILRKRGAFEFPERMDQVKKQTWLICFLVAALPIAYGLMELAPSESRSLASSSGGSATFPFIGFEFSLSFGFALMLCLWSFIALVITIFVALIIKLFFFDRLSSRGHWLREGLSYLLIIWGSGFTFFIMNSIGKNHISYELYFVWATLVCANFLILNPWNSGFFKSLKIAVKSKISTMGFMIFVVFLNGCGGSLDQKFDATSTTRAITISISCSNSTDCASDDADGKFAIIDIRSTNGTNHYLREIATMTCASGTCAATLTSDHLLSLTASADPGTEYLVKAYISMDGTHTLATGDPIYIDSTTTNGYSMFLVTGESTSITLSGTDWTDN